MPGPDARRAGACARDAGAGARDAGADPAASAGARVVDTIVAPITAGGAGERAAVRLSGPRAHELLATVLEVTRPPRPGVVGAGRLDLGDGAVAETTLLVFAAPGSFTGEDVAEVHLDGWPPLVTELVRRLVAAGARPAGRGEFTRRALLLGRLDRAGALAVGRLGQAHDVEEAQAAAAVLTGALARRHARLRDALLDALALIEAHVDFEEEDTEAVTADELRAALGAAGAEARALLAACDAAPPGDGETDVALLGPPNAGKSSLVLALCPGARTTVSPRAGTTRDMLEASVTRGGRRYRLLDGPGVDAGVAASSDTAREPASGAAPGVRDASHALADATSAATADILDDATSDAALDARAVELYLAQLPAGATVLLVEDVTAPLPAEARARLVAHVAGRPLVRVLNKCDLRAAADPAERAAGAAPDAADAAVRVSALRRSGLPALWSAIERVSPVPRAPDLATRAEREAVGDVVRLLELAERDDTELDAALPVVAVGLRDALAVLDDVAAEARDVNEEVLDRIFASFCIGK